VRGERKLLIETVSVAHKGLTHVGIFFETEGLGGVACGLEEGLVVRRAEDLRQTGLILGNPLRRGEGSGGFVEAFARDVLLADDYDHAGEQTLENVQDIADRSGAVAEGGECRTVEDHLPLDSTLGGEKRGGVDRDLDAQRGGTRQAVGGLEGTGTFDAEEHTRVRGGHIAPAVAFDEVGLEPEEPTVGTGVGGAEGVRTGERDAGPGCPVVHALYAAGETDDGGVGHGGRGEGRGRTRGKRFG
jgi:hypothetical protein